MHQVTITFDQLAGLNDRLEVFGISNTGASEVTVGKHPDLGSIVVIHNAENELLLWSERPFVENGAKPGRVSAAA
jgi:hypothetical protein